MPVVKLVRRRIKRKEETNKETFLSGVLVLVGLGVRFAIGVTVVSENNFLVVG